MRAGHLFVRNTAAPELIELFLVSGVVSVLVIRVFLAITGYPQLGGDGLHIAHMLWGGLFMAVALIGFFLIVALLQIVLVSLVALANILDSDDPAAQLDFLSTARLTSATVSGVLILVGIWRLRSSRIAAYQWFLRGVLVSIFVTQVFTFLESELAAIWGFAFAILIYTALRVMIDREQAMTPIRPIQHTGA